MENNIVISGATIWRKNFSGKEDQYNAEGNRNFRVTIDEDTAKDLIRDGWNVKSFSPKDTPDETVHYIQATVSYKNIPPKIWLISGGRKQLLDETTVGLLDWLDIDNVDLIIRPYRWTMGGKNGIKAYVKTMYVTAQEDEFAEKYKDIPDAESAYPGEDEEEELPFL